MSARQVVLAIAVLAFWTRASADDHRSGISAGLLPRPREGVGSISLASMVLGDPRVSMGAAVLDGTLGLPYSGAFRLALPVVLDDGAQVGSASAMLGMATLKRLTSHIAIRLAAQLGVRAPVAGEVVVSGEEQLTTPSWGVSQGAALGLHHKAGLALTGWVRSEPALSRFGTAVDYSFLAAGRIGVAAGLAASTADTHPPPKVIVSVTYRPRWFADLSASLSCAIPLAARSTDLVGADLPVLGLALTWDVEVWSGRASRRQPSQLATDLDLLPLEVDNAPVRLADYVAPSRVTVFTFEATWCLPCREIHRELLEIVRQRPDLYVRTIDIDDKYRLFEANGGENVPLVIVFDRAGHEVGRLNGYKPGALTTLIERVAM
jgi:thiol-disulfide isomerase/thioredoxin